MKQGDLPKVRTITVPKFRKHFGREKGHCTWCDAELTGRKYHWCSTKCYNEFRVRYDPGYIRFAANERDKGVCANCGRDTGYWERQCNRAVQMGRAASYLDRPCVDPENYHYRHTAPRNYRGQKNRKRCQRLQRHVWNIAGRYNPFMRWEADHIIAVVEGGGGLGLENIQTLCLRCHKAETKALATRRAKQPKER